MRNKHQKGFTLIELLVVIVILGILSTISVGQFRQHFVKARDVERLSNIKSITGMIQTDSVANDEGDAYVYDTLTKVETLLVDNGMPTPEEKNNIPYFYAYRLDTAGTGNNGFFVATASEEGADSAEARASVAGGYHLFVDGTPDGITAALSGNASTGCSYTPAAGATAASFSCVSGWTVLTISK